MTTLQSLSSLFSTLFAPLWQRAEKADAPAEGEEKDAAAPKRERRRIRKAAPEAAEKVEVPAEKVEAPADEEKAAE